MSGSFLSSPPQGAALSSLSTLADPPVATDLVFGVFNGQGQFVPQARIWHGAVPLTGDVTITGSLSVMAPTEPSHPATKSYVDGMAGNIAASVQGAISVSATAAQSAAQQAALSETNAANYASGASNAASTAVNAQKGIPNGIASLSPNSHLVLGGVEVLGVENGLLMAPIGFPTSDPHIAGAFWNNGGVVSISLG